MRTSAALSFIIFLATSAVAQAEDEVITVGPWTIAASSKAEKFDSCTMSRSTDDLNASFVRTDDGMALLLDSSKWRLERGKAYEVTLVAGQRSVDARALAETRGARFPWQIVLSMRRCARERFGSQRRRNDITGTARWKYRGSCASGSVFCKQQSRK
jgi:hypothetical protein